MASSHYRLPNNIHKVPHEFIQSKELKAALEVKAYHGKPSNPHGIAEENDELMRQGGYKLVKNGKWEQLHKKIAIPMTLQTEQNVEVAVQRSGIYYPVTDVCVANVDSLTAALTLGNACVLNFANATQPGGRYQSGGRAQEEDLCRLLPELFESLNASGCYPLPPNVALVTTDVKAIRNPKTYALCPCLGETTVITAAMPCGVADRRPKGGWSSSDWARDISMRVDTVLNAAKQTSKPNIVLGAWGCGAFGNPAGAVAAVFRQRLELEEFRGVFQQVVFAIVDPVGTGNLKPFKREMSLIR